MICGIFIQNNNQTNQNSLLYRLSIAIWKFLLTPTPNPLIETIVRAANNVVMTPTTNAAGITAKLIRLIKWWPKVLPSAKFRNKKKRLILSTWIRHRILNKYTINIFHKHSALIYHQLTIKICVSLFTPHTGCHTAYQNTHEDHFIHCECHCYVWLFFWLVG